MFNCFADLFAGLFADLLACLFDDLFVDLFAYQIWDELARTAGDLSFSRVTCCLTRGSLSNELILVERECYEVSFVCKSSGVTKNKVSCCNKVIVT